MEETSSRESEAVQASWLKSSSPVDFFFPKQTISDVTTVFVEFASQEFALFVLFASETGT